MARAAHTTAPSAAEWYYETDTLRDKFASNAMLALITTHKTVFTGGFIGWERYADESYKIADAMLAARKK